MNDRQHGNLKFFEKFKNWGFITSNGGEDIFFHADDSGDIVPATLERGQAVSFLVTHTPKGKKALKVLIEA